MRRKRREKKRITRKERRSRVISTTLVVIAFTILACQAISSITSGDLAGGYNYYWQPVGPGLQLIALIVLVFVGAVSAWNYFFGKEEPKEEKKKERKKEKNYQDVKYPHERMPWR